MRYFRSMQNDPQQSSRNKQTLTVLIVIALAGLVFVGVVACVFLYFVRPT